MLNERLGKYLLLEKLPRATRGETFLAKSPVADGLNKFFIIKKTLRTSTVKIEIPSLSHSNILAIFDSGIDRESFFTVMDYFESFSLAQILEDFSKARKQLAVEQCLYIVRETAAALIYAHNYTAHGEISTDAIFIGLDGAVKVADFEFFTDIKVESQADLQTLTRLLKLLLGEKRHASPELEELYTRHFHSANELYREVNRNLNTHFPEFSSPEFGGQLRTFYSAVVRDLRNKLHEYANINVQHAVPLHVSDIYDLPERSAVTQTTTRTAVTLPDGFGEIPKKGENPSVSFEEINRENPFVQGPVLQKRPPPRMPQPIPVSTEDEKPTLISDIMLFVAVGVLLTLIGYVYKITIKSYSKKIVASVHLAEANVTESKKNNENENYAAGVISRMNATKQLAYVNVRVMGAPSDTRLFINGKELLEKPPLKNYPIFASQHTLISVLSEKTRRSDARRIMLKPGEVWEVTLSLRPKRN